MFERLSHSIEGTLKDVRRVSIVILLFALTTGYVSAAKAETFGLDVRPLNLTCVAPDRPPSSSNIALENVATITSNGGAGSPTVFRQIPGDSDHWLLARNRGKIEWWQNGSQFTFLGTALDISERTALTYQGNGFSGVGIVGMALHPDFQNNGHMYVYYGYTPNTDGDAPPLFMRLSRFTSVDGGVTFDQATEEILLSTEQFSSQHKGGNLVFGPDGYLYLALGDDLNGANSQDLSTLKGKMLRIDVNSGVPYAIPADNPLVGVSGRDEIYAWGLRHPWRWSFDTVSGELWLGDVGSVLWEEVNKIVKGGNFGWPIWEGSECLILADCGQTGLITPVTEFPNVGPTAVIGGYVYRGSAIPELEGTYIYADGRKSVLYALFYDILGNPAPQVLLDNIPFINSFAQDVNGELYTLDPGPAQIWKIVPAGTPPVDTFPQLLSETGCFDPSDTKVPASGLIPYDLNSPLWSDGATKRRWIAMPDWNTSGTTIKIEGDGDLTFPIGTVLIKEFTLSSKRIETRLLVRHNDGEWGGYSYEWNDAETDAVLLPTSKTKTIGSQEWAYPSRNQCLQCHTFEASRSLGPEIANMNGDMLYSETGITANQLSTLEHIGLFEGGLPNSPEFLARIPPPYDVVEPLELRARGYLHSNCQYCHRQDSSSQRPGDFRFYVLGWAMGVFGVDPTLGDLGVAGAKLITQFDPLKSVVSLRMHNLGLERMPPLGTSVVDIAGTNLIDEWITSGFGFELPIDQSQKPIYQPGVTHGYFIWQDADDGEWHFRWNGDGQNTDRFSGTITTTGSFTNVRGFSMESNDVLSNTEDTITFVGIAGAWHDGIDFFAGDIVMFNLFINDLPAESSIYIGESSTTADSGSVVLISRQALGIVQGDLEALETVESPSYIPAQDAGYFLWQDGDDGEWHLRWSGDSIATFQYEGIISSTLPISNVREYSYEGNDNVSVSATEILFNAFAGAGEDGLDFFVPDGARVSFSLLTNQVASITNTYIGSSNVNPSTMPFTLLSVATSISTTGIPAYVPAQDAGYFLWQDGDNSEWHLRWSGDSIKTYVYEGTISSSGGITSFSTFSFEANDQVNATPSGLSFSGPAGAGEDGLDFSVPAGSQLIFDIKVDGATEPLSVSIGAQNTMPATIPFSL